MTEDRGRRGRLAPERGRLGGRFGAARTLIVALAVALATALAPGTATAFNPLYTRGMWIWVLSSSNGGSLSSIIAQAHRHGVNTLMIKSGDGTNTWSQFSSGLVSTLHRNGIHVCAWQYVYGNSPATEAHVGAAAVRRGADCLLIDAESEYEGKYVSAQTYISTLRALIGSRFPVGLAGFPYVDYHPSFPYSVFMGPGGAQYNVPQMYWVDIGTSTDRVYAHTWVFNRIYRRTIVPLGQVYNSPPSRDVVRFRELSLTYRSPGVSWWDWQEASGGAWSALSLPINSLHGYDPDYTYASLGSGAQGDLVVWAQEHLLSAGYRISVDGGYGAQTRSAVRRFQSAHHLGVDGVIGPVTWSVLLRYSPARVHWAKDAARVAIAASGGTQPLPKSAHLRARHNELRGAPGRGWPTHH